MPLPQTSYSCMHPTELPQYKVAAYGKKTKAFTISGENAEKDFFGTISTSTYPMQHKEKNIRAADPIADKVACSVTKNRVVVAVADGCGWGLRSERAAIQATTTVRDYLSSKQSKIKDLQDAGHYLYRAFCIAHNKIIEGKEDVFEAGTTTLLTGICMEIIQQTDSDPKWCFVCASVGDCKAFLISKKSKDLVDITAGNRMNTNDATDPGPYLDHGNPDLRNLSLYCVPCEEGDLILLVSDGVHDNFDPQQLGKTPIDMGLSHKTWAEVDSFSADEVKTGYRNKMMRELILNSTKELEPFAISKVLVDHCMDVTKKARDWMEEHPWEKQPADTLSFPGKLDHTTACAFVVGQVETLSEGTEDPYVEEPVKENNHNNNNNNNRTESSSKDKRKSNGKKKDRNSKNKG